MNNGRRLDHTTNIEDIPEPLVDIVWEELWKNYGEYTNLYPISQRIVLAMLKAGWVFLDQTQRQEACLDDQTGGLDGPR